MGFTLYWGSGSPFAWRAMLALVAKGIDFDSQLLSFSAGEHKTDAYLALNPRGKVPVLVHDGFALYESGAIVRYLDAVVPEPSLFGGTPQERATVDCWMTQADTSGWPITSRVVRPIYFGFHESVADDLRKHVGKTHTELDLLEAQIGDRDTIVGDDLTAADLSWYPILQGVLRAARKEAAAAYDLGILPLEARWPGVARMLARVEAMPGFAGTWPPHWGDPPEGVG